MPYQPIEELSASLSAADLHVVVMGEPFVGIIHPCKIYNILSVGAPVLYIGPEEGHIADVAAADPRLVLQPAAHGDVDSVVGHILDGVKIRNYGRPVQPAVTRFSQEVLIPQIMQVIERDADGLDAVAAVTSEDAA